MTRSPDYVRRHAETSTTGKWDTGGLTGDQIRAAVAAYLNEPPPPPPLEDDMPALMLTDSTGADGTIYSAPLDLSSKTPLTKASYDALTALRFNGQPLYLRVAIQPDTLRSIPTMRGG